MRNKCEVIDLTKPFIFIDLTRNNTNNTNTLNSLLKKIKQSHLKTKKAQAMYTLANRTNTPMKERIQAARTLVKYLKIT